MKKLITALCFTITMYLNVYALELGEVKVKSFLNDPMSIEIPFISKKTLNNKDIRIASKNDYEKNDLVRLKDIDEIVIEVDNKSSSIHVFSFSPIKEPIINLLLTISDDGFVNNKLYEIFLDPHDYAPIKEVKSNKSSLKHVVQKGDTLWKIVSSHKGLTDLGVGKVIKVVRLINPNLFIDGNINQLKAGSVVYLPNLDMVNKLIVSEDVISNDLNANLINSNEVKTMAELTDQRTIFPFDEVAVSPEVKEVNIAAEKTIMPFNEVAVSSEAKEVNIAVEKTNIPLDKVAISTSEINRNEQDRVSVNNNAVENSTIKAKEILSKDNSKETRIVVSPKQNKTENTIRTIPQKTESVVMMGNPLAYKDDLLTSPITNVFLMMLLIVLSIILVLKNVFERRKLQLIFIGTDRDEVSHQDQSRSIMKKVAKLLRKDNKQEAYTILKREFQQNAIDLLSLTKYYKFLYKYNLSDWINSLHNNSTSALKKPNSSIRTPTITKNINAKFNKAKDNVTTKRGDLSDVSSSDVINAKLNLATALTDMGNTSEAKVLLEEIARAGTNKQKIEAKDILKRL